MDLQAARAAAEAIARLAGDAAMGYWAQPLEALTKSNVYDIVTAGDKASEAVIVTALREAFPDCHIVSEEGGGTDLNTRDAEYFWYIDPIDGTTNYAHKIPYFSISIALADRERNPLIGVVFNPAYNEMFSAARGHGATLNGQPIRVTAITSLQQAVFATGFSTHREHARRNIANWQGFLEHVRDLRRFGSAALDLCYVASGRLDGFWETNINAWDVLAGICCVLEAGGTVSDYHGAAGRAYSGEEVVASNGGLHEAMLGVLK